MSRILRRALGGVTAASGLTAALALSVLGMRLTALGYAGSPLPYYDQWIAEFQNSFLQASRGDSFWRVLLQWHNEHCLFTTRLLDFVGFALNDYWEVRFLNVVAALVRAGEAALIFTVFAAGKNRGPKIIIWIACLLVFATPLSGYNLMSGLQVSFFLAHLAMLWSLIIVARWKDQWSDPIKLLIAHGVGLLSFGSALAIPACTLIAALVMGKPSRRFWSGWIATVAASALYGWLIYTPKETTDLWPRLLLFFEMLSFPVMSPVLGAVFGGGVFLAFLYRRSLGLVSPAFAVIFGLLGFVAANAALLAVNRNLDDFHSRHWDTIALFPLALIALGSHLAGATPRFKNIAFGSTLALLTLFTVSGGNLIRERTLPYLTEAHVHRDAALLHYRTRLLSGDIRFDGEEIRQAILRQDLAILDDPITRYALHPIVVYNYFADPAKALTLLSPEIVPIREPSLMSRVLKFCVDQGAWLFVPALSAAGLGLIRTRRVDPTQ